MSPYLLSWIEFLTGRFFFTIAGAIALVVFSVTLYTWNRVQGVRFKENVLPVVQRDPLALAITYTGRVLGWALFLGMVTLAGASVSITYN